MKHDPNGPVDDFDDETWARPSLDDQVGSKVKDPTDPDTSLPDTPDSTRLLTGSDKGSGDQPPGPTQASMDSNEWDDSTPPVIEKGREIFGKYRLIELLGEGGMGQVWLVNNMSLECNRALKLIWPNIAKNNNGWKRFNREAQLMAKLNHSNAVAVYDFKRIQSMGYIEMEYVRGKSLDKVLEERKGQPMPLEWIVQILDQLCAVLQEAHGHIDENTNKPKPIIHRDLKPSNLMLIDTRPEGQNLKVLDYGIAKMVDDEETQNNQLTNVGEYLGTIGYSSPEQIRGGSKVGDTNSHYEIDGRSDIYSVGVLLYQFLTGTLPFKGSSMAVLAAHLTQTPPPMSEADSKPRVPPEIERIVTQCLAKDPNLRPQTAHELAVKFRAAASVAKPAPRTDPWRLVLACVGLVLLAAAVFFVYWKNSQATNVGPETGGNTLASPTPPTPGTPKKRPVRPSSVKLWIPEGYKALDPNDFVSGITNQPRRLKRIRDAIEFERFKDGVYLPVGYIPEPESSRDLKGDWPLIIIRKEDKDRDSSDRVRFIRIKGKTFQSGDTRPSPDTDAMPRWVTIPDFYIQETEATNGMIEEFSRAYLEENQALLDWKKVFDSEKETNPKNAYRAAAVMISYPLARKAAQFFRGRLPTEAEWEFVAKSGDSDIRWPWGNEVPDDGRRWAHLFSGQFQASKLVKKFDRDRTEQSVYDMAGNVREWCLDIFKPLDIPKDNDSGHPIFDDPAEVSPASLNKIDPNVEFSVRGGSFLKEADKAMTFVRDSEPWPSLLGDLGFRVLIECPPQPAPPAPVE